MENKLAYEIERLLKYSLGSGLINKWDVTETRNELMSILNIEKPFKGEIEDVNDIIPVKILDSILDIAFKERILKENTTVYRDLLDTRIMGAIMPKSSVIIEKFYDIYKRECAENATNWYYELSKSSNYIRTDRIAKNNIWKTATEYGDIDITVNLSKPEKDPKDIAAARNIKQSDYPKCLLCYENVGYPGRINHPARQNHKVIPVTLTGEQWYLQYSPYIYYNEHSIVLKEEHVPMKISKKTFERLLDFIDILPHYFLGSNADLPIVGGSILSHDHFQGGKYKFPMELARIELCFGNDDYNDVKAGIVKWPMSVIRISSKKREKLTELAMHILERWREYSDAVNGIYAYSPGRSEKIPHNTVTPIARLNDEKEYELDLVLRNNRTSDEHPDGIFHPHKELHHIKKENIGLIEVMGLAVLPGRLEHETKLVGDILTGRSIFDERRIQGDENLVKHLPWIRGLVEKHGVGLGEDEAKELLKDEIGSIFVKVLEDAGVYKRNEKGNKGFIDFMKSIGFEKEDENEYDRA